ncbi:MAG: hypothetical protein JXB24_01955 [Bacteroidales bacterium]|nr:hypothetical protein [Bacteroidales bacterium]
MKLADENGFLEIVIYIVIMVVGLAASAFRNYNKRKEQQRIPQEMMSDDQNKEVDPVFDYDEPVLERPFLEELAEEEDDEVIQMQPEEATEENLTLKTDAGTEGQAVFESTKDQIISDQYNEIENADYEEIRDFDYNSIEARLKDPDAFDLKRAVIYAEILNPKYI